MRQWGDDNDGEDKDDGGGDDRDEREGRDDNS